VIAKAKREGSYTEGIADISGTKVELVRTRELYQVRAIGPILVVSFNLTWSSCVSCFWSDVELVCTRELYQVHTIGPMAVSFNTT
jgi:hypothetical protein